MLRYTKSVRLPRLLQFIIFAAVSSYVGTWTCAASILSGAVSFDNVSGLYTYSYTIDNRFGPVAIGELSILIDTDGIGRPLSTPPTTPAGWGFSYAFSGGSAAPPLNEFGAFYSWFTPPSGAPVSVGSILSGFSFSTAIGPTTSLSNNYFLYASGLYFGGPPGNEGVVEFAHIVAPDLTGLATPLPGALPLFASGLGMLGFLGWRRKRKAQAQLRLRIMTPR